MKIAHALTLIFALTLLIIILSVQLIKARVDMRAAELNHDACFCDTCAEAHWEAIRKGNPQLKMEAL